VDGLLPAVRVHAGHGHLRARPLAGPRRRHPARHRHAARGGHRGRRVPRREDRLVVQRVRVRHELHRAHRHAGAAGRLR
jgi:hypothetical protein